MMDLREFFISKYYDNKWFEMAKNDYHNAIPFPNIVIDEFLPVEILEELLEIFPSPKGMGWANFNNDNEIKLGTRNEAHMPQLARSICSELNSGYILDWLCVLTNVPGLIADTRLIGGGLHQIESGGRLGIHVDFNIEPKTKLSRKLNMLIYLNKDWKKEWGGCLELWNFDKSQCLKKIEPVFNRCVIFNTTGNSWHGHPEPLNTPPGVTRKSLALYYYTVDGLHVKSHDTLFDFIKV